MTQKCLRCGQCCHVISHDKDNKPYFDARCQNLLFLENGIAVCLIYETRLGSPIMIGNYIAGYCGTRVQSQYDFEGCPYNTGKEIVRFKK